MAAHENFRVNLATAIEAGHFTKSSIAAATHTSRSYLDDVLKGKVEPGINRCEEIARAVGFNLIALLDAPDSFRTSILTSVRNIVHSTAAK